MKLTIARVQTLKIAVLVIGLSFIVSLAWRPMFRSLFKVVVGSRSDYKRTETVTRLQLAASACVIYYNSFSNWPTSLKALNNNPKNLFLIEWPTGSAEDGWGNPLVYSVPSGSNTIVRIASLGEDGTAGGTNFGADIEVLFDHTFFKQPKSAAIGPPGSSLKGGRPGSELQFSQTEMR